MTVPVLLPVLIRRSRRCERCGLRFPRKKIQCPHCADLGDREVLDLKERMQEEQQGHANLGKLFYFIAAIVAAVLVLALL